MDIPKNAILSAFFCGTDGSMHTTSTHIQIFANLCLAEDITDRPEPIAEIEHDGSQKHFKMCFHGCGVEFGTMGVLFGSGLDSQCKKVVSRVEELISNGYSVKVNALGLSRGGLACLMLAKKLGKLPSDKVQVTLLAYDPVPGNLITPAKYFDFIGVSNPWKNMNLSKGCDNLQKALLIYPYEPLPTLAFHAPMIPTFAPNVAKYDVILGCHQGAMTNMGRTRNSLDSSLCMSWEIIKNFLLSQGTLLDHSRFAGYFIHTENTLLEMLQQDVLQVSPSVRNSHSYGDFEIIRNSTGAYLNKYHYYLQNKLNGNSESRTNETIYLYDQDLPNNLDLMLEIRKPKSWFSSSKESSRL